MNGSSALPAILNCYHYTMNDPVMTRYFRRVQDYEIDYNTTSRLMELDGELIPLSPGQIVFRKPGQIVETSGKSDLWLLTLDFSHTVSVPPEVRHPSASYYDVRQTPHALQPPTDAELIRILPTVFEPRHTLELLSLYRQLAVLFEKPGHEQQVQDVLSELLHLLAADALAYRRTGRTPSAVDRAIDYLNEHFARPVTLEEVAEHVHQNKSYLIRCFKKETGLTPIAYLMRIRLVNSRLLLAQTGLSIAEVALQCGFEDPSYFTLRFRETYGVTPKAYRCETAGHLQQNPASTQL